MSLIINFSSKKYIYLFFRQKLEEQKLFMEMTNSTNKSFKNQFK